jgi:hypothetical protein
LLEGDKVRIVTPAPGYDLDHIEPTSPDDRKDHAPKKQSAMSR